MVWKKREEWESNRDVKRRPRRGLFYCWNCDHYLMYEGERCGWCGKKHRQVVKRQKK